MSNGPENEFDLEKLFVPAWAQEPASAKHYAQYEGGERGSPDRQFEGRERPTKRRSGPPPGKRDERHPRGDRTDRVPGRVRREREGAGPGGRAPGAPTGRQAPRAGMGEQRGEFRQRRDRREPREAPPPLPQLNVNLIPDEKGVESLARQIKMTGRAYPLFDIAQMILQKPERHGVVFDVKKNAEGQPVQ